MRAVIIAAGRPGAAPAADDRVPAPLLPLVDRPFLQHVVEFLVRREVARFDFVLSEAPEKIERFLGDGARWGAVFRYHLAPDPARPYGPLRAVDFGPDEDDPFLFGHADHLPPLAAAPPPAVGPLPALFFWDDPADPEGGRKWTGWAALLPRHLRGLPADATAEDLLTHFGKVLDREGERREVGRPLRMRDHQDMIAAHRAVLGREFPGLLLAFRDNGPGGWLARNARVHPTARIFPPVYVGENSVVGAGVRLGPQASVGSGCVLDENCRLANAVVLPDSYVGPSLDLSDVVVARGRLIDGRAGAAVAIRDPSALADLAEPCLSTAAAALRRAAAVALLALAAPVLAAAALWLWAWRRGPVLHRRQAVRLPAPADPAAWRTFSLWSFAPHEGDDEALEGGPPCTAAALLLRVLPALVNAAKGDLCLVGLAPRTPEEVRALPEDWRAVYLRGRAGVVSVAAARGAGRPTADELYAAEALHVGLAAWGRNLSTLARYFVRCCLPGNG